MLKASNEQMRKKKKVVLGCIIHIVHVDVPNEDPLQVGGDLEITLCNRQ